MPKNPKILVIRFSSIGDIILTTPIIRCLKLQLHAEIDFLTKPIYKDIMISNPNISEVYTFSQFSKTIDVLRTKDYDFVIDLQNNLRSLKLRLILGVKSYTFPKQNFKRYLLIYFGINLLNDHIVDRYFKSVEKLNVYNDKKGLDYFIGSSFPKIDFNTEQDYICWCIAGTYEQKKLSVTQIKNVISKIQLPILFIGGASEKEISFKIFDSIEKENCVNLCGETTVEQSAYLMKKSKLVLTNDTGMMHIASVFNIPIVSCWGCTKPSLGFSPYLPNIKSENIITPLSKRPCSKHGQYCRFQSKGCIKEIDENVILNTIESLLK